MPPAQCRVTCFLKSSQEGQVVPLPLVNLQSSVPSSGESHFTSQECFCFLGGGGWKGVRKEFAFGGR